jgi:hypothetical protein
MKNVIARGRIVLQRHQHDVRDPLPRRGCEQPLGTAGVSSPLVIFRHEIFGFPENLARKEKKIMGWLADEKKKKK